MRKSLLCIAVAGGLIMGSSCVNLKKLQTYPPVSVEVADRYLIKDGNKLPVDMVIGIPGNYTNLHTGILVQPVMVVEGAEVKLPPVVVDGFVYERFDDRMEVLTPERADGAGVRYLYHRDGSMAEYHTTVDYAGWMKGAKMYADIYGRAYTRSIYLGRVPVDGGVLDLSGFVNFRPVEKYYYTDPLDTRIVQGGMSVGDDKLATFAAGSSQIQLSDKVMLAARQHIESILADPEVSDYLVSVTVSNSPEGTLENNRKLGKSREKSLTDFLGSTGVPDSRMTFTMHDEGWDELLGMLPSLGLGNTADIERIIRTTPDLDAREARIKQSYPADYRKMLDRAYPLLRYGKIAVSAKYKGTPGTTYVHTFSDTWSGHTDLNSFVVTDGTPLDVYAANARMLEAAKTGNHAEAVRQADLIPNVSLPQYIYSNKGMVMLRAGRTEEAKAFFVNAPSIPEACYNAGVLQLQNGEYVRAADNLAPFNDMNAAVAALYTGRNAEALDMLTITPKSPERDYLLAMAYARLGQYGKAAQLLSGAVALSPALRAKAVTEPDFNPADGKAGFGTVIGQ